MGPRIENRKSKIAHSTVAIALLFLLPAAMLYPLWGSPTAAGEDDVVFFYPLRSLVSDGLREGRLPLWNPFSATGTPLMADPQTAVFFPSNWLFVALPTRLAYSLCLFLAFGWAGIGAFLYLRRLGLRAEAACFGAIAFEFCGFLVGHRVHLGVIQTAGLLPWALLAVEMLRGARPAGWVESGAVGPGRPTVHPQPKVGLVAKDAPRPSLQPGAMARPLGILAMTLALALAAGHWPTVIQMSLAIGAYLLVRVRPWKLAIPSAIGAAVLAGLLMASQVYITGAGLHATFRAGLSYSTAIENSFFPLAGVQAFFPFLLGNRTPNFISQPWWGPWHQCEMFGYVGLATLILAAAAVAALYRRRAVGSGGGKRITQTDGTAEGGCATNTSTAEGNCATNTSTAGGNCATNTGTAGGHASTRIAPEACSSDLPPLVRLWFWLGVGAFLWMLGGYLPTYHLIYLLPVLGKVRCPGRMILVLDMALATLSSIGVHWWLVRGDDRWKATLHKACVGLAAVTCLLPLVLLSLSRAGWLEALAPLLNAPGHVGQAVREAIQPTRPAFYLPLALLAATVIAVAWASGGHREPGARDTSPRRIWILLPLLLVDLFIPCRFLDVPPADQRVDPAISPAALWLKEHAPREPYRVWGLSGDYHHRPAELLLPNCSALFGIESISYYGPLQPLEHAQLFGFKPWGENYFWRWLIRDNRLLSLFNVRYIVAADPAYRDAIEERPLPEAGVGENLLPALGEVTLKNTSAFGADVHSWPLQGLDASGTYRIELDVRGPKADNQFVAGAFFPEGRIGHMPPWWQEVPGRLRLDSEQLTEHWRHFEWTFRPSGGSGDFVLGTTSKQPIDVRNVSLRQVVTPPTDSPKPEMYADRTPQGLPSLHAGDLPVHIYENVRVQPRQWTAESVTVEPDAAKVLERLRWDRQLNLRKEILTAGADGPLFRSEAAAGGQLFAGPAPTPADLLGQASAEGGTAMYSSAQPAREPSKMIVALLWVQGAAVILWIALVAVPARKARDR